MSKQTYILPHVNRILANFVTRVKFALSKKTLHKLLDHKHIHKLLGSNLALAMVAGSFFQNTINATSVQFAQVKDSVIRAEVLSLATTQGMRYPLETISITQKYSIFHPGVDLDGITGDPVNPIMAGKVDYTQNSKFAYGKAVIVNHGNNVTSLYAHLSKVMVKQGDSVTNDTVIGLVGSTGHSSGDHLHLEIRDNSKPVNPLSVLPN